MSVKRLIINILKHEAFTKETGICAPCGTKSKRQLRHESLVTEVNYVIVLLKPNFLSLFWKNTVHVTSVHGHATPGLSKTNLREVTQVSDTEGHWLSSGIWKWEGVVKAVLCLFDVKMQYKYFVAKLLNNHNLSIDQI